MSRFIAVDLGAESGRVVVAEVDRQISLKEVHRFPTSRIELLGTNYWNYMQIFNEILHGLKQCTQVFGSQFDGIGIDTWGVDFALVDKQGMIVGAPVTYRDKRCDGMLDKAFEILPKSDIYRHTGLQFMQLNTLYQLLSMKLNEATALEAADKLLFMPDLFAYLLCGVKANELTIASTSQLLDPAKKTWSTEVIEAFSLPLSLFTGPTSAGTVLGPVLESVSRMTGIDPDTPVIATGGHDTASAVAAVPFDANQNAGAYLSCGTWSLLGVELDQPLISEQSLAWNFTNELGYGATVRYLKNIIGLWPLQECRRIWSQDDPVDYADLTEQAVASDDYQETFDADDPRLLAPDNMIDTLVTLIREQGRAVPEDRGQIVRCILESLALKYRQTMDHLGSLLNREIPCLHMIGGGIQNELLCRITARRCGIPVYAGPIEATAMGNVLIQALGCGIYSSLQEARAAVRASTEIKVFQP